MRKVRKEGLIIFSKYGVYTTVQPMCCQTAYQNEKLNNAGLTRKLTAKRNFYSE